MNKYTDSKIFWIHSYSAYIYEYRWIEISISKQVKLKKKYI